MNERIIRQELFLNGVNNTKDLKKYTALAMHSYSQIIDWLKKKANSHILNKAGL